MTPSSKKSLLIAAIAILIIMLGIVGFQAIKNSAPVPQRKAPEEVARLVDVQPLERGSVRPQWQAGGTVVAADMVALMPQVSGRVHSVTPEAVPGAALKAGTLLAAIDDVDYRLALKQARAALAQAKADLAVEKGQVALAEEEYRLSGAQLGDDDRALVLREPQLLAAEASVATAQAAVEQAEADLKRTEIRMPFDGQIVSRSVSPGSQASASTELFSVVASAEFWIEVKIPRAFLLLLDHSQPSQVSQSGWGSRVRSADLLNVLPDVDSTDRQAKVVLRLSKPLDESAGPLVLVNDFVNVTLVGKQLKETFVIPRRTLNNGNTVWVVSDGRLAKREVTPEYIGRDSVWIKEGFEAGDQLLLSQVDGAVPGMPVRIAGESE